VNDTSKSFLGFLLWLGFFSTLVTLLAVVCVLLV
jgi:hypothetical protein